MFLYIKTNILRGYGIFKNDFAHPREPANVVFLMTLIIGFKGRLKYSTKQKVSSERQKE